MPKHSRVLLAAATTLLLRTGSLALAGDIDPQEFSQIERGRYLTVLSDCMSCHTVPGDNRLFSGGRAIETPFGNIVAPNITPDLETGIGGWTDEAFDAAVRKGRRPNGSHLYPAMPYNAYTKMSKEDVLAIRAYLNTVTPVRNAVIANTLPFPFNIRATMAVWNSLYFTEGEYQRDPRGSEEWNRGAFIVQGPGHCGACHTGKSFLGGDKTRQYLRGAYLQGWSAPNITNDPHIGLGGWSQQDVITYLKSGHNRITAATGPMAEVVALSTTFMTEPDARAVALYLKSLLGENSGLKVRRNNDSRLVAGAAIYRDQCSACHGLDGRGVAELFPSLADSSIVRSEDPTTSIRIILRGARSVGTAYAPTAPGMPSYGRQLSDSELAAVLTYIRNAWGDPATSVGADDVSKVRRETALRVD
jgi:mono/diheme cytochrome c family protein